jgi:hypothetical protein
MTKQEEIIQFSSKDLQEKYEAAKRMSDDHLKKLDTIGVDIRRVEDFLQKSGYGEFKKQYGDVPLVFDGKRLCYYSTPILETKVKTRLEAHPFLGDFLESIALFHSLIGEGHEDN